MSAGINPGLHASLQFLHSASPIVASKHSDNIMAATASDVIWHVAQADVVILFQSSANAGVVFAVGMKQTGNAMAAKHVLASSV